MEATASTAQHAFGAGPRGPNPAHGPQQAQGPRHLGHPGPYGVPRLEDQPPHQQVNPHHHIQHSRPFFYIHPSQPYPSQPYPSQPYPSALPYQWPMPMPYNPYCGFPGMGGYGMMIPSPFQPSPYMEPPGYILPHSQLHLADYRRMINPHYHTTHYPQTMAYHARRFRYQHSAPANREMISSEVQTEPPSGAARSDPKLSNADSPMRSNVQTNSESGNATSCTAAQSLSPASAVQEVMSKPPAYQDMISAPTPNSTSISTRSAAPQKGSFVFQTEEVRMECRSTPTGLNILHSHETSELCTTHRVSGTDEDLVQLCSSSSLHHHKASQEGMGLVGEKEEQCLQQSCPDILLMDGSSSSGGPENFLDLEDCDSVVAKTLTERPGNAESDMDYRLVVQSHKADGPQLARNDGELSGNSSKSVHFKILHMPFDMQYLEELRKIEASVWSVESLAPYVPSAEFMIQQGLMEPHKEALSPVVEKVPVAEEVPMVEEVPTAEEVPVVEKVPTAEEVSIVEEVPTAESTMNENVIMAEMVPNVVEVPAISSRNKTDNAPTSPETSQKRGAVSDLDHQDTSFGALPTYRPSTSWLADFGNVYYYSKLPPNVEEQRKILRCSPLKLSSPKGKPNHDQEPKDPHRVAVTTTAPLRLKGCRLREKVDRRSYSDQECCANRTFNGNTGTSGGLKRERICARCLTTKCSVNKIPGSPGPGLDALIVKRQGVPVPPWEESILAQTCAACKCLPRRRVTRKGSGSDVPGGPHNEETEGETSENSSCRAGPGPKLRDPRRPESSMKRYSEKCPMGPHSKLREKNCSCEEPHHGPPAAVREGPRRHHHGNVIRERNEENLGVCVSVPLQDKWRNQNQCYLAAQKWQQEKLWRAALSNPDNTESNISKNGPRHLIKQKKHISQSQGLHRNDTRC
ncbi:uncharacterized protein LOC121569403 isoform X2 [Coregonus clupeaformis]|uniref:uncharacterized protein LOC121569403 isoform X2 n=1 Tax=Coregonus clupeaformis TaxID=59861 RepID=UPI001BE04894|nr:uncharacterized protein LOC121569403 isoform X2 [Coregonus clupeaformis]